MRKNPVRTLMLFSMVTGLLWASEARASAEPVNSVPTEGSGPAVKEQPPWADSSEREARFQALYQAYPKLAAEVYAQRQEMEAKDNLAGWLRYKASPATKIGEAAILKEVRKRGGGRALTEPDGEQEPGWNCLVHPGSVESARAFIRLREEGDDAPDFVLAYLMRGPQFLNSAWVPYLEAFIEDPNQPAPRAVQAAYILAAIGLGDSGKCREVLYAEATTDSLGSSWSSLRALVFRYNAETGLNEPVRSEANTRLAVKVAGESPSPEARVVAAQYLAEVGKMALAEDTCVAILPKHYTLPPFDSAPEKRADYALGRAKTSAMYLLFYRIRSERGLRAIFDLAEAPGRVDWQCEHEGKARPEDNYVDGVSLAADGKVAQGLIESIRLAQIKP